MRIPEVVLGSLMVLAGVFLIFTHGNVLGTNIPSALGLPCSSGNTSFCPGFTGYSIGTIVLIAGFPILLQGLLAPSMPRGLAAAGESGGLPPEVSAMLAAATQRMQILAPPTTPSTGAKPGVRFCPSCGQQNVAAAPFCNGCGKPMPKVE
jgi:hypothetical protein